MAMSSVSWPLILAGASSSSFSFEELPCNNTTTSRYHRQYSSFIITTNYYNHHYSNKCKQLSSSSSISVSPFRHAYSSRNNNNISAKSNLNYYSPPLISPDDHWGIWSALFATGAFGLWSERTKIGRMISAALVSILLGLVASNLGIIPHEAHAYSAVMEFLLPLTIPLMLFRADMRNVIKSTGKLLLAFLIGSGYIYLVE